MTAWARAGSAASSRAATSWEISRAAGLRAAPSRPLATTRSQRSPKDAVDLAEQDAVAAVDEAGRVAKRGRVGDDVGVVVGTGCVGAGDHGRAGVDAQPARSAGRSDRSDRATKRLNPRTARAICRRRK